MSHFVKLNGSFQQGPGKGDKKAVFFGLESHTMAGFVEYCPKSIYFFYLGRDQCRFGLKMMALFGLHLTKSCTLKGIFLDSGHISWI